MKKLTGNASNLQRRNERKKNDVAMVKITTVSKRSNTTTGTTPIPIRLSDRDKAELNIWLGKLSDTTGKKITSAKLLRAIIHMRHDLDEVTLIQAIHEAN